MKKVAAIRSAGFGSLSLSCAGPVWGPQNPISAQRPCRQRVAQQGVTRTKLASIAQRVTWSIRRRKDHHLESLWGKQKQWLAWNLNRKKLDSNVPEPKECGPVYCKSCRKLLETAYASLCRLDELPCLRDFKKPHDLAATLAGTSMWESDIYLETTHTAWASDAV